MLVCLGAAAGVIPFWPARLFACSALSTTNVVLIAFALLGFYYFTFTIVDFFFPALFSQLADCKLLAGTASGG